MASTTGMDASRRAARAGAAHVVSCESVKLIADKAKEIVSANGLDDQVVVINKQSDLLRVGEDLPRRADILVAEIFDTGLIGEGALLTGTSAKRSRYSASTSRARFLSPGRRRFP